MADVMQREEGLFIIFPAITFSSLVEKMNHNEDFTRVLFAEDNSAGWLAS